VHALGVVVGDVFPEQPSQVVFAQHHDVVEKLSTNLPTKRSAVPFCQGLWNAVRLGWIPNPVIERATSVEKIESLSKIKKRCAGASGKAFRSCWITQRAAGFAVTLK
jgi:hypothetical protein